MMATFTRVLLLVQIAFALLIAHFLRARVPGMSLYLCVATGVMGVLLLRASITANNFRLAARFPAMPRAASLGTAGALRMYWQELRATLVSSSWNMPFRPLARAPTVLDAGLPVLLLHGYGCNTGYWHCLSGLLRQARRSFHAVDLEPVLGDIDGYLPQMGRAIESLCTATGQPKVIVVAHSMGGLVARSWLRTHGDARVAALITLGTPHAGTGLASYGLGKNSRQMCADSRSGINSCSDWLTCLQAATQTVPLVSIYSCHDNIVAPYTSAIVPGARNIGFDGIGHVALASHPAVTACVLAEVARIQATFRRRCRSRKSLPADRRS